MHNRIKEVRKASGLSQKTFGDRIGLGPSSMQRVEAGIYQASEQTIRAICSVFNVDRHWLETGEGEMYVARGEDEAFMARALAAHNNDPLLKAFLSAYLALNDERRAILEDFVADFTDKFVAAQSQGRELSMEEYMAARASAPAEPKTSG